MSKTQPRVMFYFLHLLGVGHVHRAQRLISQFSKSGISVDVIYGGMPVPEMSFEADSVHFLPPIQAADNTYANNLDGDGAPLSEKYLLERQRRLLETFENLTPDMILIEAYPFGRRVVRNELKQLLEVAKTRIPKPIIASSVRDILQEKRKVGRAEETRDLVSKFFDVVFVHSDPTIIKLNETYPLVSDIEDKLSYTGFVVPEQKTVKPDSAYDIIISAGGGAFGKQLMITAMNAAQSNPFPRMKWCFAAGPNLPAQDFIELRKRAPSNVEIVKYLPHLASYMAKAKLSISQCGYNTAMDIVSLNITSACRAVFVPYDTEGQTEQLRRAALLDQAGYAVNLPQSKLDASSLIKAMQTALKLPKVDKSINFSGALNTANSIKSMIESQRSVL